MVLCHESFGKESSSILPVTCETERVTFTLLTVYISVFFFLMQGEPGIPGAKVLCLRKMTGKSALSLFYFQSVKEIAGVMVTT